MPSFLVLGSVVAVATVATIGVTARQLGQSRKRRRQRQLHGEQPPKDAVVNDEPPAVAAAETKPLVLPSGTGGDELSEKLAGIIQPLHNTETTHAMKQVRRMLSGIADAGGGEGKNSRGRAERLLIKIASTLSLMNELNNRVRERGRAMEPVMIRRAFDYRLNLESSLKSLDQLMTGRVPPEKLYLWNGKYVLDRQKNQEAAQMLQAHFDLRTYLTVVYKTGTDLFCNIQNKVKAAFI